MYLDDEFEKQNNEDERSLNVVILLSTVFVFVLMIFGVVLFINRDRIFNTRISPEIMEQASSKKSSESSLISGETIVSDDLDIWEEFPAEDSNKPAEKDDTFDIGVSTVDKEKEEDDPSEGGLKTKIIHSNGAEEWQYINQYLTLNEYDNANFVLKDGRLSYYDDGKKVSYTGVEVSKYNGYVDFNKMVKDDIDFCMIRVGGRTYSTGQISLDEYYVDNLKRATDAGMNIGLVFSSQAITEAEAIEEAQFVLNSIGDYEIKYPICFDMEPVANDKARIDDLSKEDRTKIARAFMDRITEGGYTPVLYGDKEWLLTKLNFASISYYDIWYNQHEDLPDFPYDFKMWKYKNAVVDGISGKTDITISFIDYSMK